MQFLATACRGRTRANECRQRRFRPAGLDFSLLKPEDEVVKATTPLSATAPENAEEKAADAASLAGFDLPVSSSGGGPIPGVRLDSNADLEDRMNGAPQPFSR